MRLAARRVVALVLAAFCLAGAARAGDLGAWHLKSLGGRDGCTVERLGGGADIWLMKLQDGAMLVALAHRDWKIADGAASGTLTVDRDAPQTAAGFVKDRTFLVIPPAPTEARLRRAAVLHWHLQWGDFDIPVDGLGAAYDALAACH